MEEQHETVNNVKKEHKSRINFRCFLVCGAYVILATIAALVKENNAIAGIIFFVILVVSSVTLAIICYIFSAKPIKLFTFILSGILCFLTLFCFTQINNNWVISVNKEKTYSVSGIIESLTDNNGGETMFVLDNIYIDGEKTNGKMYVEVSNNLTPFSDMVGYKINFNSALFSQKLIDGYIVNGVAFRKNIRYKAFPSSIDFEYKQLTVRAKILRDINNILVISMGKDYGSIAYTMLTGDKNNLDYIISDYFSVSGLAHIMAVSGLHIGFIVMVLVFLFRRLKVSPKIHVPIILAFLIAYALLIGFSPSVLRSIFMCAIGLLTTINGKCKDQLSALMFSLCVIVSLSPIFLFEVGFAFSFGSVLGLILFANSIEKFFRKIKTPKFLASPLSVSISAQIGIIPALAFYFNQMQVYSVIANVFLIPIIMFSFLAIMVVLPLVLAFPALAPLMHFAGTGLVVVDSAASFISRLPFSNFVVYSGIFVFICYPLYFLISRFTMFAKYKKINSLALCAICLVVLIAPTMLTREQNFPLSNALIPVESFGEVTTIAVNNGEVNIIGDFKNASRVKNLLIDYNILKINAIVVFSLTPEVARQIIKLKYFIQFNEVYCPQSGLDNSGMSLLTENGINNFFIYDIEQGNAVNNLTPVSVGKKTNAFLYKYNNANVLFTAYSAKYSKIDLSVINSSHIIRSFLYEDTFSDRIFITNMPSKYLSAETPNYQFSLAEIPNIIFDVTSGKNVKYNLIND